MIKYPNTEEYEKTGIPFTVVDEDAYGNIFVECPVCLGDFKLDGIWKHIALMSTRGVHRAKHKLLLGMKET